VRPAGFEPAAYGLEVRCSIQLSYERGCLQTKGNIIIKSGKKAIAFLPVKPVTAHVASFFSRLHNLRDKGATLIQLPQTLHVHWEDRVDFFQLNDRSMIGDFSQNVSVIPPRQILNRKN
jgi:hypothetical protein